MTEVRVEKDHHVKVFNALAAAVRDEQQEPGDLRSAIERAFERVYRGMETTDFLSVRDAPGELDTEDQEKFKSFNLGLLFGNWLAVIKGIIEQQAIRDHEKN